MVPEWLVHILATILILIDVVNTSIRLSTSQTGNSAIVSLMSSYVRSNRAKRDPERLASATGFRPPLQYRSWRCRVMTDQSRREERLRDSSEPRKPIRKEAHIGLPRSSPSRRRPYRPRHRFYKSTSHLPLQPRNRFYHRDGHYRFTKSLFDLKSLFTVFTTVIQQ
jgi:hypothetical protein